MRAGLYKILITGGAGFIGSAFVRNLAGKGYRLAICDKLTYAGDLKRLEELKRRAIFYKIDICDAKKMTQIFRKEKPQDIVNFAAETHVDRSIRNALPFIKTNIIGLETLLALSRKFEIKKFIHISSDEVYGETKAGKFDEDCSLRPSNPYSASKAAGDLLINSYIRTFNFPAIIVRPCNNYGPWQYPEKLIPLTVLKIQRKEKIPLYGDGRNTREWLYVDDCAEGILKILKKGKTGKIYNLGSAVEKYNIDVVRIILKILKKDENMIQFVKDRPGHDIRYRLNSDEVFNEIGWSPNVSFEKGLENTVSWCLRHKDWLLSKWNQIAPLYK